jgi:hypothetical protein
MQVVCQAWREPAVIDTYRLVLYPCIFLLYLRAAIVVHHTTAVWLVWSITMSLSEGFEGGTTPAADTVGVFVQCGLEWLSIQGCSPFALVLIPKSSVGVVPLEAATVHRDTAV